VTVNYRGFRNSVGGPTAVSVFDCKQKQRLYGD
jgi:hypothetical protein